MAEKILHYEISWVNFEGCRRSKTFTNIDRALIYATILKNEFNVDFDFYEVSREKKKINFE